MTKKMAAKTAMLRITMTPMSGSAAAEVVFTANIDDVVDDCALTGDVKLWAYATMTSCVLRCFSACSTLLLLVLLLLLLLLF